MFQCSLSSKGVFEKVERDFNKAVLLSERDSYFISNAVFLFLRARLILDLIKSNLGAISSVFEVTSTAAEVTLVDGYTCRINDSAGSRVFTIMPSVRLFFWLGVDLYSDSVSYTVDGLGLRKSLGNISKPLQVWLIY